MRGEDAQLLGVVHRLAGHELDAVALGKPPIDHAHQHDHAHIGVIPAVNDHGAQGTRWIAFGMRHPGNHSFQNLVDAHAGLGTAGDRIGRINADHVFDFLLGVIWIGLRQIHLVQHRHDLHPQVQRGVAVGNRLRLNTLAGIDDQQRTFTGRQRATHFI